MTVEEWVILDKFIRDNNIVQYQRWNTNTFPTGIFPDEILVAQGSFEAMRPYHTVIGENECNVNKYSPDEKYSLRVSIQDLERLERIFILAMTNHTITPEELRLFLRINTKKCLLQEKELSR